jgi:tetrapyrrole methylase family protein/MazG family protein
MLPGTSALVLRMPLHMLDHHDIFDHLTTLYVPAMSFIGGFEAFQETIAFLRAPNGCPWDREQTHESLRSALLEEVYEVLDALDQGDLNALQEELGDVLMNVLMQIQIATEGEEFRMVDVIGEIDAKLKRRHPHVFGDVVVNNVGDVLTNWNAIKQQEHKSGGKPARESAIDGVPPALPALAQAQSWPIRPSAPGSSSTRTNSGWRSRTRSWTRCLLRATTASARKRWATCSSPSPTWPTAIASISRRRCAKPI